ncbi:expressed unknown protein [Seminavis robusta]|uniref:Uncharacterized protein n=1 Tax=Seminavis robusta TaxID=568900 RepID=A0A9N8HBY6_9STRA|nr:expressed unknown protein [Seminavis robusta]|eukprot:Sro277_g106410.1 n/a (205) ;mRNA; r:75915-76529
MVTKRPLASAAANADRNGGKQLRFDLSQIKPLILKRSEILSSEVARLRNEDMDTQPLPSCLRTRSTSWALHPETMTPMTQDEACSVQFRSNVTVKRIPSRHEYSPSTRRELWSSLKEIRENALRNEAEFSFDGCNWRECCEEDDMFYDKRSDTLIHPAHVETVCVYNGREWKPIANEETTPDPTTPLKSVSPSQVCIVCDFGSS